MWLIRIEHADGRREYLEWDDGPDPFAREDVTLASRFDRYEAACDAIDRLPAWLAQRAVVVRVER